MRLRITDIRELTKQQQISGMYARGMTMREIQKALLIKSISTVSHHIHYKKKRQVSWLSKMFLLPERTPVAGKRGSELLCAGFNEYRRIILEKLEAK